jgi:large subunit ribosomal protein L24
MKQRLKKGDTVLVIAGNDKGKTGEVQRVLLETNRVIVEGVNMRWRHKKPTQKSPKGERVSEACSIHASNVMHVDPATGKGVRKRPEERSK